MKIVKDIAKIQNQIASGQPLWICLPDSTVGQMAIGWIADLAKNNMIGLPSDKDLKNYEFMIVARDAKKAKVASGE